MNRADWQQIAEERLLAVAALLAAGRWPSAYYLAGYAVECGLKSCILVRLAADPGVVFDNRSFLTNCWTHKLEVLLTLAGLDQSLNVDMAADPSLQANWLLVKDWSETSRYEMKTEPEARAFCDAIAEPAHGVMQWIRRRW